MKDTNLATVWIPMYVHNKISKSSELERNNPPDGSVVFAHVCSFQDEFQRIDIEMGGPTQRLVNCGP